MDSETKFPTLSEALSSALDQSPEEVDASPSVDTTEIESAPLESAPETEAPVSEPTIAAPEHWSSDRKDTFKTMPPEAQKWALELDKSLQGDYTKKTTEIADIRKALEPYREHIKLRGMTEGQVIEQLLAAQSALDRDPLGTIKYFAKAYNVDLKNLLPKESVEEPSYVDPEIKALREEIDKLKGERQTDVQLRQQNEVKEANQRLNEFITAKDEAGAPKYPHFETVRKAMGAFMQTGESTTLQDAYEKAIWANPAVRENLIKAQAEKARADAEARADLERKAKANAAKKAASRPNGKGGDVVTTHKDLSGILADVLSQHGA